MPAGAARL